MSDATKEPRDDAADEAPRIDKRQFIRMMAKEADVPLYVAAQAYEAFVKVLLENVRLGAQINLTGFGKFYWQQHGGHKVQFGAGHKEDYKVLKFSATRKASEFLDYSEQKLREERVPGTRVLGSQSVGEVLSPKNGAVDEDE